MRNILGLTMLCTSSFLALSVKAETCNYIAQQTAIKQAADKQFAAFEKSKDCSMIPALIAAVRKHNDLSDTIRQNCPGATVSRGSVDTQTLETELRKVCKLGPAEANIPAKVGPQKTCVAATDARACVALEQRGTSGRWHNFRLVNSCDKAFNVKVFSCYADWAGGCKVEETRVGACETTGSASEGKQSWDRDAELR